MFYWDNKASLVVKDTQPNDSGRYRCEVSNYHGVVDSTANLNVYSRFQLEVCFVWTDHVARLFSSLSCSSFRPQKSPSWNTIRDWNSQSLWGLARSSTLIWPFLACQCPRLIGRSTLLLSRLQLTPSTGITSQQDQLTPLSEFMTSHLLTLASTRSKSPTKREVRLLLLTSS